MSHYDYTDHGYGVTLSNGQQTVFLQGDDASQFLSDVETIDEIWNDGNPNPGIFREYEDHLDLLIDPYFG